MTLKALELLVSIRNGSEIERFINPEGDELFIELEQVGLIQGGTLTDRGIRVIERLVDLIVWEIE